ncbi:MAG: LytTR family DNA-binding domain-containing protein [Bacteroidota bacterium]
MSIRCIIADDEPIARQIVEQYMSQLPQLELIGACANAFEVLEMLQQQPVDLLFLDINMPNFSGISLIRSLQQRPEIILTTAYPEFALEGFELAVADYLLKPFSLERFIMAVNKVRAKLSTKPDLPPAPTSHDSHFQKEIPTHITLKVDKKWIRCPLSDIYYIEAYGNYIKIHLSDTYLLVSQTLTDFLSRLPQKDFLRVHKSYVIHFKYLTALEGNTVFLEKAKLPVGKTFKESVLKRIQDE